MINKTTSLYMLVFCYAVFSFAVYIPKSRMNLYSWLTVFTIALALKIIFLFLIRKGRDLKSVKKLFVIYLVFLLSLQTNKIFRYLRLYHNKNPEAILIVTILLILIFVVSKNIRLYRYAKPLFCFSVVLVVMVVILNINKVNIYNLFYHSRSSENMGIDSITLFDYIAPMCLIQNSFPEKYRYKFIQVIFSIDLLLLALIIFIFSCFRGNLVYSISPLQIIFQLSNSEYIRNFDAMYSFMLIMQYFASVILILWSIKEISDNNNYIKYGILFLYLVMIYISFSISDIILCGIHLAVIILFRGGGNLEKS